MHNLLTRWLKKHNVENPEELDDTPMPDGSPTERQTFEEMRVILSKEELTLDDVRQFCENQVGVIERKWADLELGPDKKAALIPYHTVYKAILNSLGATKSRRELIERQLELLTK